jgi:hypothetical protein
MAQTLKLFLVPGSIQFLAIGLALGVGLLYGSTCFSARRPARISLPRRSSGSTAP